MKISSDFTNDRGVPFLAVRLEPGERYGYSGNCVATQPLIEFYDRRYPHCELGQLVTRYYATTLAQSGGYGLVLDGGVPDWQISVANLALVDLEL